MSSSNCELFGIPGDTHDCSSIQNSEIGYCGLCGSTVPPGVCMPFSVYILVSSWWRTVARQRGRLLKYEAGRMGRMEA